MKKRKIMLLLPCAALLLGGCSFQDVKNWVGSNIYFPVKNWVEDIFDPDGKKEEQEGKLQSIEVSGEFQTRYAIGEQFDKTGIIVTAVYDNGSKKDVSSEAQFSGFDSSAKGSIKVTVSYGGKSAEIDLTIYKAQWDESELALFNEHLHGIVLPFIDVDGMSLKLEDGWVYGSGGSLSEAELLAYEALYTTEAGWTDITEEYTDDTTGAYKAFRGSASTSEGIRYIDVIMYTYTGSSYTLGGSFVLQAADTYEYSFPDMAALFEKYPLLTPFEVPSMNLPDGGYYYVSESQYNALYYQYEMYDSMTLTVWGYNAEQETFDAFLAKFSDWTVTEDNGKYTAILPVEQYTHYEVTFSYSSQTKIIKLLVTLGLVEVAHWPTADVATLVEKVVPGSTTVVPALEGGSRYSFYGSIELDVYGDSSLLSTYIEILTNNSWTQNPNNSARYISPAQDLELDLNYSSTYKCLEIQFFAYVAPSAQWPTDAVAALFPSGTQDVLPPFEGDADSFQVYNDSAMGVTVFVGEGNEDAAIDEYIATLTTALFTESETKTGFYESPNKEYYVEVWKGTNGAFNIEVSMIPYFPTAGVAEALQVLVPGTQDSIPAFEGASKYTLTATDEKIRVAMQYSSSTEAASKANEYCTLLTTSKLVYAGNDEYGDPYFNSEHEDFCVNVWVSSSAVVIDIYPGAFVPPTAGFPSEDIENILKAENPNLQDSVPAYDVEEMFVLDDSGYYALIELAIACDSSSEASAHVTAYASILTSEANGYTAAKSGSYGGTVYASPNGEIYVYPYVYGSTFYIDIDLAS